MRKKISHEALKKAFAAAFIICLSSFTATTLANLIWQGTINWAIPEVKDFSVWNSATDGTLFSSPWALDAGILQLGPNVFTFWLQNDGNAEITVIVSGSGLGFSSASWSNSGTYGLAVDSSRVEATLTITVTDIGNYDFSFSVV